MSAPTNMEMEFSKINEHGSTLVENPTDLEFSFSKIGLTPEENKFLEAAASTNQEIAEGIKMKLKKASTNQFIMRNISLNDLELNDPQQIAKKSCVTMAREVASWLRSGCIDGDCLRFNDSGTLPAEFGERSSGYNIIYLRQVCWHLLWIFEYIIKGVSSEGIVVLGPPGCGKTWCSQFFLWYFFVVKNRTVVFESASAKTVWVFKPEDDRKCYLVSFPASIMTVPELISADTVYIHDSMAHCREEMAKCAAKKIVWSSANSSNYAQTARDMVILCFPTPNKEELARACELFGRMDVDVQWCFAHSGGSLRNALKLRKEDVKQKLTKAAQEVKLDNIIKLVKGQVDPGIVYGRDAPTGLFTTQVSADHLANLPEAQDDEEYKTCRPTTDVAMDALTDAYRDTNVQWLLCSEYVFDLVRNFSGDEIQNFNQRFLELTRKNPTLGGARGNSFQIYAPKILAAGKTLPCRQLILGNVADETLMKFDESRLETFTSTDLKQVLSSCVTEGVLFDICGSLAGIDGLKRIPTAFLQYTSLRKPPHLIDYEAAVLLCEDCKTRNEFADLYFVVPSDTFALWKRPQSFAIKDANGKKVQRALEKLSLDEKNKVSNLRQFVLSMELNAFVEAQLQE